MEIRASYNDDLRPEFLMRSLSFCLLLTQDVVPKSVFSKETFKVLFLIYRPQIMDACVDPSPGLFS